jgi:glycosyltransferase involved in cell wall biosynthesis
MPSPERGVGSVLVLVPGALGAKLSGPEIRALRLARVLSAEHEVTLMAPGATPGERSGMAVVPFSRLRLLREARRHDAILAATIPPFVLLLKRWLGVVAISDQYDPVELELGTLDGATRATATARAARRLQLRCADVVLCAADRQRLLLETELASLGEERRPRLRVVPFGIDADPPAAGATPLRDRFPQIKAGDRVVLWWGSLWRWLDAETVIRAAAAIAASDPRMKLVFTAGRPPNGAVARHSVLAEAKELARELGVLDRSVLFLEEWVPYDRRADYLRDADLGITLHRDTAESPLAARARYMDYLWAGLPCVLGRGDETAARFETGGFARLVAAGSVEGTVDAVLSMLDEEANEQARKAGRDLAEEFRWEWTAAPLMVALGEAGPHVLRAGSSPRLLPTVSYYFRRLVDRALPSA